MHVVQQQNMIMKKVDMKQNSYLHISRICKHLITLISTKVKINSKTVKTLNHFIIKTFYKLKY